MAAALGYLVQRGENIIKQEGGGEKWTKEDDLRVIEKQKWITKFFNLHKNSKNNLIKIL